MEHLTIYALGGDLLKRHFPHAITYIALGFEKLIGGGLVLETFVERRNGLLIILREVFDLALSQVGFC